MAVFSDYYAHEVLKFLTGQVNALGAAITPWLALFSTVPASDGTGGVEETGANLARKNVAGLFAAPAGRSVSNNAEIDIGTASADLNRVYAIGIFDASSGGQLHGICRLHGQRYDFLTDYLTDSNQLAVAGHPFQDGDRVMVAACPGIDIPSGLAEDTTYYVVNSGTGLLELALTNGGAALDIGSDGAGFVVRDNSKLIENGDPVKVSVGEFVVELG